MQPSIFRETLKNQPPVVTMKRPVVEYAMIDEHFFKIVLS